METPPSRPSAAWLRRLGSSPWASACVTAAVLAGLAVEVRSRGATPDVAVHHETIRRAAAATLPYSFGDWVGRDVEASSGAVEILRPSALVRRDFENLRTGETASLLFVQCGDARDLIGHYPPVCYPAHGLIAGPAVAREWSVGGVQIPAMRYRFDRSGPSGGPAVVVDNFMVLPGTGAARDMADVRLHARDVRLRRLGAAQFQVVTDGAMGDERRDAVFAEILAPNLPLLRALTDFEVGDE